MDPRNPPEWPGLPVLGSALDFQRDRTTLLRRAYNRLGPIFTIRLGNRPTVVLVKPEYHEFFFTETDKKLRMDKPYEFLAAMFGKIAFTASPEVYQEQRHILLAPFQGRKMPGYIAVMQQEVEAWMANLGEQGDFELVSELEKLTLYVAAHALLGRKFRQHVGPEFWRAYRDLAAGMSPILPPHWPLPRFRRRDRAKAQLHAMIGGLITERRSSAQSSESGDFLQDFIDATYKDGRPVEDALITNLITALVFAGHETTAGQASWTIIELLRHPDYLQRVLDEQAHALTPGAPLELGRFRQLQYTEWALREVERMHPSADILLRYNAEGYTLGGYDVPEGWFTMVSAGLAHRLPELFRDPDRFDPLRFSPDREEDKQHRFALIGFGGGTHKCAGMSFAMNEMTLITTLLLQHFDLELLTPDPVVTFGLGASRPTPTHIRYRRRAVPGHT
jgi:sterol 14-demethylase